MKKLIIVISLLLSMCFVFCGCRPLIMVMPDTDSTSQAKTFEKDGIKLTLTDQFTETKSKQGFYAYYTADFCGVVVLKEDFSLEEGLADLPLEEYITNVIANNGHTDIEPQSKDGLWYYIRDTGSTHCYSFSFKGSDAFWIVQYICKPSDASELEDTFFLWANTVEVD